MPETKKLTLIKPQFVEAFLKFILKLEIIEGSDRLLC